jgi:hypothetical protein
MSADGNTPDYSMLTPEEIEAIQADPSASELVTMRQAEEAKHLDDEDETQYADDDHDEKKGDEAKSADDTGAKADDVKDDLATDAGVKAEAIDQPAPKAPIYDAKLPDNFQEQVDGLKTERTDLKAAYKNGDIDFDEYEEKREALDDRNRELDRAITKAEIAQDINVQSNKNSWADTVYNFATETAKNEGIDYRKDAAKQADLDLFIKALAAKDENADKPMDWFLQQAHAKVKALHGIETKKPDNKQDAKRDRKPPVESIPKTLANVIGGDDATEIDGKYSDLDKMDGLELETALARMSPDERSAYLRGV